MQASVTATALNVRSIPDITGRVLGVLPQDTIVDVVTESGNWLEIKYRQTYGFISRFYANPFFLDNNLRGLVTADLLNVRQSPSLGAAILGTLTHGSTINLVSRLDDWLEIEFNQGEGFVAAEFVDTFTPQDFFKARVIASLLNVRTSADSKSAVLGTLARDAEVDVLSLLGKWAEIRFNNQTAFISAQFIERVDVGENERRIVQDEQAIPAVSNIAEADEPLAPEKKLPISGNATLRKVAGTWNRFGGLLQTLSAEKNLDVGYVLAVLCVESAGKGFDENNDGRMIIRFENHKFWKFWGRQHPETFHAHFRYAAAKVWTQHQWRARPQDNWLNFHGNQQKEWQVLEFAQSLDNDAALLSISMGAPQIMGFHFERLGYASVSEMFHHFGGDISSQIKGLFNFFSDRMIADLRAGDFESFAGAYNGSGQRQRYGRLIRQHHEAFEQLT